MGKQDKSLLDAFSCRAGEPTLRPVAWRQPSATQVLCASFCLFLRARWNRPCGPHFTAVSPQGSVNCPSSLAHPGPDVQSQTCAHLDPVLGEGLTYLAVDLPTWMGTVGMGSRDPVLLSIPSRLVFFPPPHSPHSLPTPTPLDLLGIKLGKQK